MYEINGFLKFAEQDEFEEGCLPDTGTSCPVDLRFSSETVAGIINEVCDFFGVKEDALELDACDEPGRIDVCRDETDDGSEPSEAERAAWKQGKFPIWYVVYSGYVQECRPFSFTGMTLATDQAKGAHNENQICNR